MDVNLAAPPCSPVLDLCFDATFEAVSQAGDRLAPLLNFHFGEERGVQLRLGIIEAMTNVVEHGCAGREGGYLHLLAEAGMDQWCFTLTDNGRPIPRDAIMAADGSVFDFDPKAISELPEGGMGLSLIQMVFDQVDYKVAVSSNRLLLTAYLSA